LGKFEGGENYYQFFGRVPILRGFNLGSRRAKLSLGKLGRKVVNLRMGILPLILIGWVGWLEYWRFKEKKEKFFTLTQFGIGKKD